MREQITAALTHAQKAQDRLRVATLRLVNAAIQDRDIANRGKGKGPADEAEISELLQKMIKQREESARLYREGGRPELEAKEAGEIAIIREFLPSQLSDAELAEVIAKGIAETGAGSVKDMGKVMGWLKEHYRGQVDMAKAGPLIKARFS
ncbi:MAG: GatB/YqeY domain-containing protein [Nitratireductor sp.]|nr:GatB/YqeY domain-containing protein [Nitratireductor sp.]